MFSSEDSKLRTSLFQTPSKKHDTKDGIEEDESNFSTPDMASCPLPKTPPNSAPTQNNVCPPTPYILDYKLSRSPFTTSKKGRPFPLGNSLYTSPENETSLDTNTSPIIRDSTPTFQRENRYKYSKIPLFGSTPSKEEINYVTPLKKLKTNKNPFADNDDIHELEVPPNVPQFLSFFSTVKVLGTGSFGQVYLCRHRTDGWNYAVKKIKYKNQNEKDQFLHEVYLLAAIGNHPHFIRYHNSFSDEVEKTIYIQTEFCNAGSLNSCFEYLKTKVKRVDEIYYETLRQIGTALNYLHNVMKCVHMDVKPANIFVCEEKDKRIIYKLGDFGRSRVATEDKTKYIDTDEIDGDGKFLAPELLKTSVKEYLLPKVDIYSLAMSILSIAGVKNPKDTGSYTRYFDSSLSKLLCKMMKEDPEERISSKELLDDPLLLHPEIKNVKIEIDNLIRRRKIENNFNRSSKYVTHMGRIPSFELGKAVRDIRRSMPSLNDNDEDCISTEDERDFSDLIEEEEMAN